MPRSTLRRALGVSAEYSPAEDAAIADLFAAAKDGDQEARHALQWIHLLKAGFAATIIIPAKERW